MIFQHRPPYSISGQAGKALGPQRRTFEAAGIEAATLVFRSMDADELTWFQRGGIAPDWMEEISLWDAYGRRIFIGAANPVPEWKPNGTVTHNVTAAGPWWWLEQAQLSALATDATGAETERPEFVTSTQDLAVSIRALLDRMNALGVPLRAGEIAETFTVPQMVFQGADASAALRTMLAWLYDAMTRVDYGSGVPALSVYRRSSAPVITWHLGADGCPVERKPLRLTPRRELRPALVRVQSATVDAEGNLIYGDQVAGEPETAGVLGKQLIAISGPGATGFSEADVRRHLVKTATTAASQAVFYRHNAQLASLKDEIGGEIYVPMTTYATFWVPNGAGWISTTINNRSAWVVDGTVSTSIPSGVPGYLVIGDDLPDWWSGTRIATKKVKITQRFTAALVTGDPVQAAVAALAFSSVVSGSYTYYFADFEIEATAVALDANATAGVVVVHPDDAALVQPTGGLADALFRAQDWTPFEGEIPLIPGSDTPMPGNVVCLRGGLPEWETMRSLVSAARIDLRTGAASISLGSPPRERKGGPADTFAKPTGSRVLRI
jgi:hypothetical protein